jgi:hypothetical protein
MNEDLIRYRREKSKETLEDAYVEGDIPLIIQLT